MEITTITDIKKINRNLFLASGLIEKSIDKEINNNTGDTMAEDNDIPLFNTVIDTNANIIAITHLTMS